MNTGAGSPVLTPAPVWTPSPCWLDLPGLHPTCGSCLRSGVPVFKPSVGLFVCLGPCVGSAAPHPGGPARGLGRMSPSGGRRACCVFGLE